MAFRCIATGVFIATGNITVSLNIPSHIIWPTLFFFGCALVDEGCA